MTKIEERRNIIESLKISYTENVAGIDKRIKNLKISSFIIISLSIILGVLILTSVISEQIGFETLKWNKLGMTISFTALFYVNLTNDFFKLKLLKHLKKIHNSKDNPVLEKLNLELKNIVSRLNNRKVYAIILMIILVMGLWQSIDLNNPYWNYMKLPIILFLVFMTIRFIIENNRLTDNIKNTENTVANNS